MRAGAPVNRFAPSPTGRLHLGHAWSALLAMISRASARGRFCSASRISIRAGRASAFVDGSSRICFGSPRMGRRDALPVRAARYYAGALDRLKADGLVYPCFCTPVRHRRERQRAAWARGRGLSGDVPGFLPRTSTGRTRGGSDAAKAMARAGPLYGWTTIPRCRRSGAIRRRGFARNDSRPATISRSRSTMRRKGSPMWCEAAILSLHRHPSTAPGSPRPANAGLSHHALLADAEGGRLAKRNGAPTLADLRDQGMDRRR